MFKLLSLPVFTVCSFILLFTGFKSVQIIIDLSDHSRTPETFWRDFRNTKNFKALAEYKSYRYGFSHRARL